MFEIIQVFISDQRPCLLALRWVKLIEVDFDLVQDINRPVPRNTLQSTPQKCWWQSQS